MPRSLKKGPFVASYVFEKVQQMNSSGIKTQLKLGRVQPQFYLI